MKDLLVWTRIGDNAEYESHETPHIAGLHLRSIIGRGGITWRKGGISTLAYRGLNYISLYWGDEDGDFVDDINPSDRLDFEAGLS